MIGLKLLILKNSNKNPAGAKSAKWASWSKNQHVGLKINLIK